MAQEIKGRHIKRCWPAVVLAACWLFINSGVRAVDYTPISLECLLAGSDAALVAKLPTRADFSTYAVQVIKVLRGNVQDTTIRINEPAPWRGAPPHFDTQEALLFLKRTPDGTWEVVGPSGEGRIPLRAHRADVTAIQLPVPDTGNTYPSEPLLEALERAAQCFSFERDNERIRPVNRCDKVQLEALMGGSAMHYALFQRLLEAQRMGLPCKF